MRTIAAYKKKIYASNRADSLEKYIMIFNDINNKQHGDIITIGKIKQEKKLKNEKIRINDAEFKNTKKVLLNQLKEKTFEQKFKSEQKERRKYEKHALSGVFKKSFVYGDDIDGLNGFNAYNRTIFLYKIVIKVTVMYQGVTA